VKDFCKGTKRDVSQYPILKDERQFGKRLQKVLNLAISHQISEVFDTTYRPTAPTDVLLFEEKQQFAFTVLDNCLQINMVITLVHAHHEDNDAQTTWKEFLEYMKNSTTAENSANELLAWLTSTKYDHGVKISLVCSGILKNQA
jgi:hypothetical protein